METLFSEIDSAGRGPRLVLVHGFSQNRDCWGPLAGALAETHEVVRVDAPGHGRSGADDASLDDGARLLGATGGRAVYVGYSMGGRIALHLAVARPELVTGLALIGSHPGIEDVEARRARAALDEDRARRLETIGLEPFLDEWLAQPMFAGLSPEAQARPQRRQNRIEGLAASLRHAGTGHQRPLWDVLPTVEVPVLLIAGEHDEAYRALHDRMAPLLGGPVEVAVIPGAGHAAHLERPDLVVARLRRWLASTPAPV